MKNKDDISNENKSAGKRQCDNVNKRIQPIKKRKTVHSDTMKELPNTVSEELLPPKKNYNAGDSEKGSQGSSQTQKNISQGGIENIISKLYESLGDRSFKDCDIEAVFPNLSKEKRVDILNQLLIKDQILVFKENNELLYKWKSKDKKGNKDDKDADGCELSGLDGEEKLVYQIIKEAGNKGIWMRDIRFKSNILPNQLNKILKSLENKKVVKAVKSVSAYKKKVYMLYDLEPDHTLTGGSWYQDQDFESEFVDVLNEQCYRYLLEIRKKYKQINDDKNGPLAIRNMCSVLPKDVCKFITDLGISKIPLSEQDIKSILETLVYDGKVERKVNLNGISSYRAIEYLYPNTGVVAIPCSVCRIIQDCHELPQITSEKCQYLDDWLNKAVPDTMLRKEVVGAYFDLLLKPKARKSLTETEAPLKLEPVKSPKKNHQFGILFKGVKGKDKWGKFDIQSTKKGLKKVYITTQNEPTTSSDKIYHGQMSNAANQRKTKYATTQKER